MSLEHLGRLYYRGPVHFSQIVAIDSFGPFTKSPHGPRLVCLICRILHFVYVQCHLFMPDAYFSRVKFSWLAFMQGPRSTYKEAGGIWRGWIFFQDCL